MATGLTTVSATNLCDATGTPISSATIYFTPADNKGNPIAFRLGGSAQGQVASAPVSATVNNGAFSLTLADTSLTTPLNVGYRVTCISNTTGLSLLTGAYLCVQPTGSAWSFDAYVPNVGAQAVVQTGPTGPQGAPGIASLPQLASIRAAGPIANLFDSTKAQLGYYSDAYGTPNGGGTYPSLITGKIPANSGGTMTVNAPLVFGAVGEAIFYDVSGAYLSNYNNSTGAQIPANTPIAIPATAAFVAFAVATSGQQTAAQLAAALMIVNGSTLPSSYISFELATKGDLAGFTSLSQLAAVRSAGPIANLFDSTKAQLGYYFNVGGTTGGGGAYGSLVTAKIPANSGGTMTLNAPLVFGAAAEAIFYDATGAYLSTYNNSTGAQIPANTPIAIPATAAFVAFAVATTGQQTAAQLAAALMIVNGSTLPSQYIPFNPPNGAALESFTLSTAATSISSSLQSLMAGLNLFNPSTVTAGEFINYYNGDGTLAANSGFATTDYIAVPGGGTITCSVPLNLQGGDAYAFFDANKQFLSLSNANVPAGTPINVPANACFARFSIETTYLTVSNTAFAQVMIVWGSTLPSTYTPFGLNTSTTSPLRGVKVGVIGDSISSIFGLGWQQWFEYLTGAKVILNDARSGRQWPQAFEFYGTTTPGGTLTTATATNVASSTASAGSVNAPQGVTVGNTLAQNLAPVQLLIIRLGTNDENYTVGAQGDATNAGTLYGNMRWVVETLLNANPTMRIIMWSPALNAFGTLAQIQAVVSAELAYGASMGIPVLNWLQESGINTITSSSLTRDSSGAGTLGTHPNDFCFRYFDGPAIARFAERYAGLSPVTY